MLWGEKTWILFHYLAEKIKEKYFLEEKKNLFFLVTKICYNLPCPSCKNHAIQYLKNKPLLKFVKTKNDFKKYLFYFHNTVNKKKNNPEYDLIILKQYKNYNFAKVINDWLRTFKINNTVNIHNFMLRSNIKEVTHFVIHYLKKNYYKFLIN